MHVSDQAVPQSLYEHVEPASPIRGEGKRGAPRTPDSGSLSSRPVSKRMNVHVPVHDVHVPHLGGKVHPVSRQGSELRKDINIYSDSDSETDYGDIDHFYEMDY